MYMAAPRYFTADMVRALPEDGKRYETVFGELLVSPSPARRHQLVHSRLFGALHVFLTAERIGIVMSSPADISFGRDDVLVQPDLFVLSTENAQGKHWANITRLLLAIEILSPSSIHQDRFTKRRLYQTLGTDEYWIVDHENRCVEIWTPDATFPLVREDVIEWRPSAARNPLRIALKELFAD
jgi:Uma2 family endonuclease